VKEVIASPKGFLPFIDLAKDMPMRLNLVIRAEIFKSQ
jgi:hypothetical protein